MIFLVVTRMATKLQKKKKKKPQPKQQHDGASKSKATTGKNTRITNQEHCHTEQ